VAGAVLLVHSTEPATVGVDRLKTAATVLTLAPAAGDADPLARRTVGACCAGAAARLLGVVSAADLQAAIREELGSLGRDVVARNVAQAREAFEAMAPHAGLVREGSPVAADGYRPPAWVDLASEGAERAAPAIHRPLTSVLVRTGLWRTLRPVLDPARCNRCWWVCGSLCPDGAIGLDEAGYPLIDYDHCKGCLICVAQCPAHAIQAVPEHEAATGVGEGVA
jgi:pyruvate ferredoxin oxidoreductase gamma subunit